MKPHFVFKNNVLIYFCLTSLFLFFCSGDSSDVTQEILYNVVEHEWTIGGDNYEFEDEFILAWPFGLAVMDNGDILTVDEDRIKVFDSSGNEKIIVGNPGEGPGEFDRHLYYTQLTVNLSGELTINGSDRFYVFSPKYEFVETGGRRLNQKQKHLLVNSNLFPGFFNIRRIVTLNENDKIYSMDAYDKFPGYQNFTDFLIFENTDTLITIYKANRTAFFVKKEITMDLPAVLGRILFAQMPGERVIYTHSGHDYESRENQSSYLLKVFSLDTFEEVTIDHTYDRIEIDYEFEINSVKTNLYSGRESEQSIASVIITNDYLREKKFYPPVQKILYDNGVIFVFTYKLNETGEVFTDIFDAETLRYLRSAYFPGFAAKAFAMVEYSTIKNGYLYYLKSGREVFAEIQKFRFDPSLYAKK